MKRYGLLISLILFVGLENTAKPKVPLRPKTSRLKDITFHPNLTTDEYIEVWNFIHVQKNLNLFITFLVSNIGPGDLNNGISILLQHKGKSKVITAEYSEHSLQAKSGRFGIRSGRSYFKLCGKDCIHVHIQLDEIDLDLKLRKYQFGPKLSDHEINISAERNHFFSAFIPIKTSISFGTLRFGRKHYTLKGKAGMEYMRTNRSPQKYAHSIHLTRSLDSDTVMLGFLDAKSKFLKKTPGRVIIQKDKKIILHDYIVERKILKKIKHPTFDLSIPSLVEYYTKNKKCKIKMHYKSIAGSMYIYKNVSYLLRLILKVLVANPYILYYNTEMVVNCFVENSWQKIGNYKNLISAMYLIDE